MKKIYKTHDEYELSQLERQRIMNMGSNKLRDNPRIKTPDLWFNVIVEYLKQHGNITGLELTDKDKAVKQWDITKDL